MRVFKCPFEYQNFFAKLCLVRRNSAKQQLSSFQTYLLDMPQLLHDLDWSEHARALVQLPLLKSEELVLNQLFLLSGETKSTVLLNPTLYLDVDNS